MMSDEKTLRDLVDDRITSLMDDVIRYRLAGFSESSPEISWRKKRIRELTGVKDRLTVDVEI